jgi:hypothetical protein
VVIAMQNDAVGHDTEAYGPGRVRVVGIGAGTRCHVPIEPPLASAPAGATVASATALAKTASSAFARRMDPPAHDRPRYEPGR